MQHIHVQEEDQLKKLFDQEGVTHLEERIKIMAVFLQTEKHLSSAELIDLVCKNGMDLEPEFVIDTLKLMCRYGFAQQHAFDNGVFRYEHRHLGQHHDHMVCTKCKKIIEFQNDQIENLQVSVTATHGFHMLQHKMEIYGICSECLKKRMDFIPLMAARQGERLIIKNFTGGAGSRMRLMSMGLRVGDEVDIITNLNQGQLVIAVENKRLVMGRGLAEKIIVRSADISDD
ncbi:MAG: transcriptional repressor [Deltaproteobacteria bacterium]|nr:transcriptional repressor [Deltaproteobacteria bacterium]